MKKLEALLGQYQLPQNLEHIQEQERYSATPLHRSPERGQLFAEYKAAIDIRKDKGMVKFVFVDHFLGVQLDGATGRLLHIEQRRSDIIENIHDGSILDYYFQTKGEPIKLAYTSIMGFALLTFTITGFWLWYGPKRMRKNTANR